MKKIRHITEKSKKLSDFFDKGHPSTMKTDPFKDFDKALAEAIMGKDFIE